jgi:membrane-bound inhibitor of C-type lysozyme
MIKLVIAAAALVLLSACSLQPTTERHRYPVKGEEPVQTFVFQCGDQIRFTAHGNVESKWLFLPGQTIELPRVAAASGEKYSDGETTYWQHGEETMLETDGQRYSHCMIDRRASVWEAAKLRGVDFRAVGNEPGWVLELGPEQQMTLVTNDGEERIVFDLPPPEVNSANKTSNYTAKNDHYTIDVTITGTACNDAMSGDSFEATVAVNLNYQTLRGCGQALH